MDSAACALDGPVFVIDESEFCCTVLASGWIAGEFFTSTLTSSGTFDVSETKLGNVGFGLTRLETRKRGPFTMLRQRPLPPPEITSLPWLELLLLDD